MGYFRRARAAREFTQMVGPGGELTEDSLHADQLGPDDLMLLWMAQGSTGAGVTLPSGRKILKAETWDRLLREAAEIGGR